MHPPPLTRLPQRDPVAAHRAPSSPATATGGCAWSILATGLDRIEAGVRARPGDRSIAA